MNPELNFNRYYFDMDIINQEFSANREVLVLPKTYGTLDSDFTRGDEAHWRFDQCASADKVRLIASNKRADARE